MVSSQAAVRTARVHRPQVHRHSPHLLLPSGGHETASDRVPINSVSSTWGSKHPLSWVSLRSQKVGGTRMGRGAALTPRTSTFSKVQCVRGGEGENEMSLRGCSVHGESPGGGPGGQGVPHPGPPHPGSLPDLSSTSPLPVDGTALGGEVTGQSSLSGGSQHPLPLPPHPTACPSPPHRLGFSTQPTQCPHFTTHIL